MSVLDEFEGYTPAQVAEKTLLFSETELKRMCARGEIQHHRGARGKVIFYRDDVRALLRQFRRAPAKKRMAGDIELAEGQLYPTAAQIIDQPTVSPFRTTPRSRAAHKETARRSA